MHTPRTEYVLDPCPHCNTSKIGAHFAGERSVQKRDDSGISSLAPVWICLFVCKKCNHGVVAELMHTDPLSANAPSPSQCDGDPRADGFLVRSEYPEVQNNRAPSYTPRMIAKRFNEGVAVLRYSTESAVMLFRKVLETALNDIDPASRSDRLSDRIKKLCKENKLSPQMGDWARVVLRDGNDAAHGDQPPTKDEARQTMHFAEVLLQYLFTLPEMIKRHRQAKPIRKNSQQRRASPKATDGFA